MTHIAIYPPAETGTSGLRVTSGQVFSFPTHAHMYYEMTLYEPFQGSVCINQQVISMTRPAITLMTPSDFHRIQFDGGQPAAFVKASFEESVLPAPVRAQLTSPIVLQGVESGSLPHLLFGELQSQQEQLADASILLSAILMYLARHGERLSHHASDSAHELALKATRILNERFCEAVSLHDIARELSVSQQYLSHVFSKTMGMTFSEHLTGLRLRRAAELLRETTLTATQICYACGYRNFSHFLRSFKRKFGLSPMHLRAGGEQSRK